MPFLGGLESGHGKSGIVTTPLIRGAEQRSAGEGEGSELLRPLEPSTGRFPENCGDDTIRKFTNVPCVEKVGLHESLDREQVSGVTVLEVLCRAFLEVKGEMVVLAA